MIMQLILKGLFGLTFIYYLLIASLILAYAEVPDITKWSCPDANVKRFSDFSLEVMDCDNSGSENAYVKVSGELVYIHEHRMDADKAVYYNALKTGDWWTEVVNKKDLLLEVNPTESGLVVSIVDDNGVVVAKRLIPFLKK